MAGELTWQNEDRCEVGETVFQTLPDDLLDGRGSHVSMEGADFWLFKERPLVERYVALVEELRPRQIFELGIFQGGSTAFLYELARPAALVAIDQRPAARPRNGRLPLRQERRPERFASTTTWTRRTADVWPRSRTRRSAMGRSTS